MRLKMLARVGALGVAATAFAGCGDAGPTAPLARVPVPKLEVVDPAVWADPLLRETPMLGVRLAIKEVGPAGGELVIDEAGLKVTVPRGALAVPTRIWVAAIPGKILAYEFGPHGTRFEVPLKVEQSLSRTNWGRVPNLATLEAGYFADVQQIDFWNRQVLVNEFLPLELDVRGRKARFEIEHFSGYMVSSGRKGGTTTTLEDDGI